MMGNSTNVMSLAIKPVGARHQSGWLPAKNSSLAVPRPIIQIHSRFDIKVGARHQSGWLPAINSSLAVPLP
ncbi:hypothetical protein, partial [Microseira wollei]|uniref:hypothetical protein n=1 Tax=Microseira wollei TaxID=467598 RepID=UPI001CFCF899